jgi:hypothetical protein
VNPKADPASVKTQNQLLGTVPRGTDYGAPVIACPDEEDWRLFRVALLETHDPDKDAWSFRIPGGGWRDVVVRRRRSAHGTEIDLREPGQPSPTPMQFG